MRIALGIEYDGSFFCGWQIQDHSPSVQAAVEAALSSVATKPVRVHCAGRTDTGVHAIEQVVHFDTSIQRPNHAWVLGANTNLPTSVRVRWAQPIGDEFHARFSAIRRRYRYVILNRNVRPTFLAHRVSWEYRQLNVEHMQAAAVHLRGQHDFSSYRAQACQAKSPVRHLHRLDVTRQGELLMLDLEADGFLHHMVRNIAGVLLTIGAGERDTDWSAEVLGYRNRTLGGVTAPPSGLYLMGVSYPEEFALPQLSSTAMVW